MVTQTQILLTELAARERLLRDQRTSTEQAETLLQIADALQAAGDLENGLDRALQICSRALKGDVAVLLQRTSQVLETLRASDPAFGLPAWPLAGHDLLRPLCITSIGDTRLGDSLPDVAQGCHSLLSTPLPPGAGAQMVLVLLSRGKARFTPRDQVLLDRIGGVLAREIRSRQLIRRNAILAAIVEGTSTPHAMAGTDDPALTALGHAFDRLTDWQNRIIQLNNDLLGAPSATLDSAIDRALAEIGQLVSSDRTYVFRLTPMQTLDNTHEWVAPGIEPMKAVLQNVPVDVMADWREDFEAGRPVSIPDVDALPSGSTTRDILRMQGILSLLAVPILHDGMLTGFVGHDFVKAHRRFLPTEVRLLQSVANTLGAVVARRTAEALALSAQISLAEERDRLQATLSALPDLVLELDQDGRFTGYNFGGGTEPIYAPGDFVGRLVEEALPPDLARRAREVMQGVDLHGHHSGLEYSIPTRDGEKWYAVSAGARRNSGRSNGYVFLIRDVTERHHNERQIRRLSRIAELTSNLAVITDLEGRIDWVNPAFEVRTGWTLEEVRGRKPGHFLQFDGTDPTTAAQVSQNLRQGRPVRAEILNRSRDGTEYWVSKDIQPLLDRQGQPEGFLAIQTDITELKKAHQQELQPRIMAIEASMDGIAICGADGRYVYMNPAYRDIFGIGPGEDIKSISFRDQLAPEAIGRFDGEVCTLLEAQGRWQGQMAAQRGDDTLIELDIALTLTDRGDTVCIARDITEQHRLEAERARLREQLQLAQRRETLSFLASGVAHDLNNLVAVVSGTVTLMQAHTALGDELAAGLRRIARAIEAAHDLVRGLSQLGRPDMPRGPLDLRKLVIEAIDLLCSERVRRHGIHADLPASVQMVWANQTELLQVIVNLALNACEAANDTRNQVTLAVVPGFTALPDRAPDAGEVNPTLQYQLLRIRDKGEGIDPALRTRLFERYLTTKSKAGTGLGLPIVASILRENDGALWFDSSPGEGTTVTVAWPSTSPMTAGSQTLSQPASGSGDLSGHRILVVDDNMDVAEVLGGLIEADGAIAIAVADPVEAKELLRTNPGLWSALVTDFDMPGMNGAQLARVAGACTPPVPSILVTALPESGALVSRWFHAVHAKPVNPADLIQSLRSVTSGMSRHDRG
jgi:PAS domain S-box-containing protein